MEVDAKVLALAENYLGFKSSDRNRVTIQDGRMFLRHTKATYDWIILDAFRGGFVPPHLKTAEFYKLARAHLTPDGLFVANVRTETALFASDLRTLRTAFPQVGFFDVPQTDNAILVGANFVSPPLASALKESTRLGFSDVFKRNVNITAVASSFHLPGAEADQEGKVLTDDFAPTEFLDALKSNKSAR